LDRDPNGRTIGGLLAALEMIGFCLVPEEPGSGAISQEPTFSPSETLDPEVSMHALNFYDSEAHWETIGERRYELRVSTSDGDLPVLRTRPSWGDMVLVQVAAPEEVRPSGMDANQEVCEALEGLAHRVLEASRRPADVEYQAKVLGHAFSRLWHAITDQVWAHELDVRVEEAYARVRVIGKSREPAALAPASPPHEGPLRPITPASRAQFRSPELYQWQQEAAAAWLDNWRRGLIEAVTGAGKTRVGLAVARWFLAASASNRVVVLVPRIELMYQWRRSLAACGSASTNLPSHADAVASVGHCGPPGSPSMWRHPLPFICLAMWSGRVRVSS
jgi:hypothetical protein